MEHNTHAGVPGSRDTSRVSGGRRLRKRSGKKENMVISYHLGGRGGGWRLVVNRVAIKFTNNNILKIHLPPPQVVN